VISLATVLAVGGTAVGVVGLAIGAYQVTLGRRAATLAALIPLYRDYQSPALQVTRDRVYQNHFDLNNLSADEDQQIRDLLNALEFLGALVTNHIVSFTVVKSLFHNSPLPVWNALEPFVRRQRAGDPGANQRSVPGYAKNYETLVGRY